MRLGRFGRALCYLPLPEVAQQAIIRLISEPALDRHRSRSTFGLSIDISSRVPCPDSGGNRLAPLPIEGRSGRRCCSAAAQPPTVLKLASTTGADRPTIDGYMQAAASGVQQGGVRSLCAKHGARSRRCGGEAGGHGRGPTQRRPGAQMLNILEVPDLVVAGQPSLMQHRRAKWLGAPALASATALHRKELLFGGTRSSALRLVA